jgi:hypothetical protein
LYIQIEISQPENTVSFSGVNDVYAVDSLGNYYYSSIDAAHDYNFTPLAQWHSPFVRTCCSNYEAGSYSAMHHTHANTYELLLANYVSVDAEWIELRYDRDGKDYTMRINLPGGVSNG